MVSLLTIEILSILATTITNLLGILTFATDYWTVIVYDVVQLRSTAQWIVVEELRNGDIQIINTTNETQLDLQSSEIVLGIDENLLFSTIHKGLFRQCNYLSEHLRNHLNIPRCRALKTTHNQYDDLIHGMINPGREFIRNIILSKKKTKKTLNLSSSFRFTQYCCILCNSHHSSSLHLYSYWSDCWNSS